MQYRALIVEDNEDIAERVIEILDSLGHDHVWAKSQEEARQHFAAEKNYTTGGGFHYVLLDLSIPVQFGRGLDSIEYGTHLAKEIHQSPAMRGVPMIVMTAYGKEGLEFAAPLCEYGVVDFINKPFPRTGRTLASVIQSVLERMRQKYDCIAPNPRKVGIDKPFQGGELAFHADRVELCGVTVLSSSKSNQMWAILDKLKQRLNEHRYRAFPGSALADKGGQGGVAGSIRDFRRHVAERLGRELGLKVEPQDVIETSGGGYRLNARIVVKPPAVFSAPVSTSGGETRHDDSDVERRNKIIVWISGGERLRIPGIAERLDCSYATAKRGVEALKAEGRIEFVGPTKTGYYQLTSSVTAPSANRSDAAA